MNQYKIWFNLMANKKTGRMSACYCFLPSVGDIEYATNGFWLNKHGQFTKSSDAEYYVPASQILCIVKEPA